jgi:heme exporter protein B
LRDLIALIKKDCAVEFRSRYTIASALSFSVSIVCMLGILFSGVISGTKMQAALYWLTVTFASMQFLAHLFIREEEEETSLLLQSRFSSDAIFLSKLCVNILLSAIISTIVLFLFLIFLSVEPVDMFALAAISVSGSAAIACVTCFAGSLAARAKGRNALFAILSVPAILPVLVSATHGTTEALTGSGGGSDALFCVSYAVAAAGVSLLLYRVTGRT